MTESTGAAPPPGAVPAENASAARRLREHWRVIVQRRMVVLTCLGVTVVSTMVLTFFDRPEYQAATTLQIDRQAPDILAFKDVVGADPAYVAYQDFYQTQYRILQSRTVALLTIERVDLLNRPEFATRKPRLVERIGRGLRALFRGPRDDDPLEPALRLIHRGLAVRPVRNSQLVEVAFVDEDPALARDIANALAEAYLQFNYQARYDTTGMAKEFLTKEVARLQSEVAVLEQQLQAYGTENEILALSDGTQDISEQALADLNRRLIETKGRVAAEAARATAAASASSEALPEVLASPLISSLKQQHAEVERRYSQMAERFKSDWPPLMQLAEELAQARQRLELETRAIAAQVLAVARGDLGRARAELANLEVEVAAQKGEVQRVNRDAIEYAGLKAAIETKRQVLADLVARQSETETTDRLKSTRTSNIRVVDAAQRPREAVRPNRKLNLALALLFGTVLGLAMALLLDYLDNTIKSEQDVIGATGFPVLGYVPKFQALQLVGGAPPGEAQARQVDLASHLDPRSGFAEACKNLRTSMLLATPDRPPRHVLVTSCDPREGKSTVSTNLAIVLTQLGRRVLLVDADLRRPRLHEALELDNREGLTNLLTGTARPEAVVRPTLVPGLWALTSGPIPPNPSELLGSSALESLLTWVREDGEFDYVLFDSPPLRPVSDPLILGARVDGVVIVARVGETSRDALAQAAQRLRRARVRVLGVVLNALTAGTRDYYHSPYYHYERDAADAGGDAPAERRRAGARRRSLQG